MKNKNSVFTWKIGGAAGDGQQAAGNIFAKACANNGYYSFTYSEFPSVIRGGHVTSAVSVSKTPIRAMYREIDILIALNEETVSRHIHELSKSGIVIYDSEKIKSENLSFGKKNFYKALPLARIIKENNLKAIAANMVALGASVRMLKFEIEALYDVIDRIFSGKSEDIRNMNRNAAKIGYDYAEKNFNPEIFPLRIEGKSVKKPKIIINSNHAAALAALAAGCRLYVAYPMSPATTILHTLAAWSEKTNMLIYQPEDEIAAVHIMLGAMNAGTRSMTATSGGGFALMTEAISLAGMTETPGVILVSSRPAPATGLPTWTEQGDLHFAIRSGHGDFPKVVLAPSGPEDTFKFTAQAFNLAEKYQVPVIILIDKYLSEGHIAFDDFNTDCKIERGKILSAEEILSIKNYRRYSFTKDGVSPRILPGFDRGVHLANSDEHDEFGFSIEGWNLDMRHKQMEKRELKIKAILKDLPKPKLYGPLKAKITLLGWGSTKGPVLEALKSLTNVNYIHVGAPWPIPIKEIEKLVKNTKKLIAIENNFTGQFAEILQGQTGIAVDKKILKYDGRQFYPEEIVEKVKKII